MTSTSIISACAAPCSIFISDISFEGYALDIAESLRCMGFDAHVDYCDRRGFSVTASASNDTALSAFKTAGIRAAAHTNSAKILNLEKKWT